MDLDEIQLLIIEEIAGTITPADKELLYNILSENEEAFARWQDMHQVLSPEKAADIASGMQADRPDEIIRAVNQRKRNLYFVKVFGVAAAIILLLGTSWFLFFSIQHKPYAPMASGHPTKHIELQLSDGKTIDLSTAGQQVQVGNLLLHNNNKRLRYTPDERSPQLITLRIPAGKDYTIVLSDSTEIMLNAASSLQFPSFFTGNTREVNIQGEAFLKVAPRSHQPFIVHLPGHTVRVLGTSFNVNTYDSGQVKVALVSGAVSIKKAQDSFYLKPGYQATSDDKGMRIAHFDEGEVLSWRQGIYEFYNVPFITAAGVISRWYGINVVIDNTAINNRPFTGTINRNKPVKEFLENMKATNGLNYSMEGETLHIR